VRGIEKSRGGRGGNERKRGKKEEGRRREIGGKEG
jgi:hypothetical protein